MISKVTCVHSVCMLRGGGEALLLRSEEDEGHEEIRLGSGGSGRGCRRGNGWSEWAEEGLRREREDGGRGCGVGRAMGGKMMTAAWGGVWGKSEGRYQETSHSM